MVDALQKPHYVSPRAEEGAAGIQVGLYFPPQRPRFAFQGCHGGQVGLEGLGIGVEIILNTLAENLHRSVDGVEESVYGFDGALGLLCREN